MRSVRFTTRWSEKRVLGNFMMVGVPPCMDLASKTEFGIEKGDILAGSGIYLSEAGGAPLCRLTKQFLHTVLKPYGAQRIQTLRAFRRAKLGAGKRGGIHRCRYTVLKQIIRQHNRVGSIV